jgi:hypothetical protein
MTRLKALSPEKPQAKQRNLCRNRRVNWAIAEYDADHG